MWTGCRDEHLVDEDVAASVPAGATDVDLREPVGCELHEGHGGRHGCVYDSPVGHDRCEVWVWWGPGEPACLLPTVMCPATTGDEDDDDLCLLPAGHESRHTDGQLDWA